MIVGNLPRPSLWSLLSLAVQVLMILVNSNYTKVKAISVVIGTMGLFGGLEALLILTLRVCFNVLDELE